MDREIQERVKKDFHTANKQESMASQNSTIGNNVIKRTKINATYTFIDAIAFA